MGKAENVRLTVFYIHIFSTGGNNWLKLQLTRTWQTENYWIDPLTTDLDQFFNNIWPYILYDVILEILTLSDPDTFQFGNFLIFINSNNFILWHFPILYHLWHFHILTLSDFEKFWHFQILTHSDSYTFRFGPKKDSDTHVSHWKWQNSVSDHCNTCKHSYIASFFPLISRMGQDFFKISSKTASLNTFNISLFVIITIQCDFTFLFFTHSISRCASTFPTQRLPEIRQICDSKISDRFFGGL